MNHWNDFMGPLIYLNSEQNRTLAIALQSFQGQYTADWNLLMAASVVVLIPVLIIFFTLQRYFVEGIVLSGLK
jgi:multiple sugar transport system permease protein